MRGEARRCARAGKGSTGGEGAALSRGCKDGDVAPDGASRRQASWRWGGTGYACLCRDGEAGHTTGISPSFVGGPVEAATLQ